MQESVEKAEQLEKQAEAERLKAKLEAEKQARVEAIENANASAVQKAQELDVLLKKGEGSSVEALKFLLEQFKLCEKKLHQKLLSLLSFRSHFLRNVREGTVDLGVSARLQELDNVKKYIERVEHLIHHPEE